MGFLVRRLGFGLVAPSGTTPSGELPLSCIDKIGDLRMHVRSLHVFAGEKNAEPAKTIKQALGKALVFYYPLAGQFVEGKGDGEVRVDCTGEGVWFSEAAASCSLHELDYFNRPSNINTDVLIPDASPEKKPTGFLFLMQVTTFTCGGFTVGLQFSHALADGLGAGQFITAVAEIARGLESPSVTPIWSRELLPNPPKRSLARPPAMLQSLNMTQRFEELPLDFVYRTKSEFYERTAARCSTFDVSIAAIWQSRTRAIGFAPGTDVHLCFMASVRQFLTSVLPNNGRGYYGNCFCPLMATTKSEFVAEASITDLVQLIRKSKKKLPVKFGKWARGESESGEDPYDLKFNYETLFTSDWKHLGFNEVDYGYGRPVRIVPFWDAPMPMCILGLPPAKKGYGRVMVQCVEEEHSEAFLRELKKIA